MLSKEFSKCKRQKIIKHRRKERVGGTKREIEREGRREKGRERAENVRNIDTYREKE